MFDFLKKKISDFTGKLKDTLKGRQEEEQKKEQQAAPKTEEPERPKATEPIEENKPAEVSHSEKKEEPIIEKPAEQAPKKTPAEVKKETKTAAQPAAKQEEKTQPIPQTSKPAAPVEHAEKTEQKNQAPQQEHKNSITDALLGFLGKKKESTEEKPRAQEAITPAKTEPKKEIGTKKKTKEQPTPKPEQTDEAPKILQPKDDDKRELRADAGIFRKLAGFVSGKIKITEKDTRDFFDELELSLLESDVEQQTALAIVKQLQIQLVGREISAREDLSEFLNGEIKRALEAIMTTPKVDLENIQSSPLKILFIGPNGAGKTTSIAKLANYFLKKKKSVILAAGDTFRAAAIAQLEAHANRLGVKIVKQNYGADPAAVAFDAVKAAQAGKIDVVLIDTAGRQETNRNLVEEMKKIERVVKPDLKIYVGEAYTGQALLAQASEFDKAIGLDGFILTKIDTDAKGGTAISLLYTLKKPILFVGMGQGYDDLLEFTPKFIIDRII